MTVEELHSLLARALSKFEVARANQSNVCMLGDKEQEVTIAALKVAEALADFFVPRKR